MAISNSQAVSPICLKALCRGSVAGRQLCVAAMFQQTKNHSQDSVTAAGLHLPFLTQVVFLQVKSVVLQTLKRCFFDECSWIHAWFVTLSEEIHFLSQKSIQDALYAYLSTVCIISGAKVS